MVIDSPVVLGPTPIDLADGDHDMRRRRKRRRRHLTVLALAALIGALLIVGILVDPSAGAAGGCGGG